MLKFISFGSGSCGNCYYLSTGNNALLIDVGVGIRTLKKYFREYGLSFSSVHSILVTHDHADHIKSVGSFSHDNKIPVYATREVHVGIERNYSVHHKVPNEHVCIIDKGETFTIGDFTITPFGVPHDSTDNTGYFIEVDGKKFCLITDAGYVTEDMGRFIGEANYLVFEANHDEEMVSTGPYPDHLKRRILSSQGHLSNKACGQALVDNMTESLRHVWLCHLSEENNHPELARKTVANVLSNYGIIADKDFVLDVLKRKTPTGIFEL